MKRVIIIHAWWSSPEQHWYQEEKKILEGKGYRVDLPKMPGDQWPKLDDWLKVIGDLKPDENTTIIGHSLGVPAALRFLEGFEGKIDKFFSVAGFAEDLGIEETKSFFEKSFNLENIKEKANKFIILNENKDPYVPLERGRELAKGVMGEFIEVEGNIHFDKMDLNLINSRL